MKRKFLTASGFIAALLLILLSLCLGFGLWMTVPRTVHADGDEQTEPTVTKNEWLYTGVTGWEYNSFDADKNVFIAVPRYGNQEKDVQFELYKSKTDGDESLYTFRTDADGKVSDVDLNGLSAGDYYVIATVTLDNSYGNVVSEPAKIPFKVSPVENKWVVSPSLVSWKWGSFDESINVITAQAEIGNADMYFRIYYLNNTVSDGVAGGNDLQWIEFADGSEVRNSFKLTGGVMPQYVKDTLKKLDVGTYHLVATVDGSADGNYSALSDTSPFNVIKAENAFTNLTIEQWTWREYNYINNVINADVAHGRYAVDAENTVYDTDKYDTLKNITYSVYYDDNGTYGIIVNETLRNFKVNVSDGRVVGVEAREALKALNAGKYWLVAQTNDKDKNYADATMQIQFSVAKHSNYWTATPSVLQWTWGEYDPKVNVISGAARFNDSAVVNYGVFTRATCMTADAIIDSFTLGSDGYVTEEVAKTLKNLGAGTYYLKGWTADNSVNYNNCDGVVPFTVQKARNGWIVSPYVISWQYGQYNRNFNVIKGEARYDAVCSFSVYTDEKCTVAVEFAQEYNGSNTVFVLDEEGLVPAYVSEKLAELGKGTYYLVASVDGTANYYGVNDGGDREPVPFEVTALENYWTEAPGLIGWSEGHFSAFDIDDNLSGIAAKGDVRFTIFDEKGNTVFIIRTQNGRINSVQRGNGEAAKVSDLNSLSVGSYELLAVVDGDDNYTGLTCNAQFAVFEDSVGLTGIIVAVITFAILDIAAAGACIALLIIRRRKVEEKLRNMIRKELHRR